MTPMTASELFVAIVFAAKSDPVIALTRYVQATRTEPPLYPIGSVVRLRCDGGAESRFGSVFGSARDVERSLDPSAPIVKAERFVRSRSRLQVLATRRFQQYSLASHTKYIDFEILEVEPLAKPRWIGFVQSLDVDPNIDSPPADNFCD